MQKVKYINKNIQNFGDFTETNRWSLPKWIIFQNITENYNIVFNFEG